MQKNWIGIVVLVVAAELAALLVLMVVWLPRQMDSKQPVVKNNNSELKSEIVDLKNQMAKVLFRLERMSKDGEKGTDPKIHAELKQVSDNIDDIGSQIYDFERANQKNLMMMQKNIMRRLSTISPSKANQIPTDPTKLKEWLAVGGIEIDKDKSAIRLKGRIVNPTRPLELIAATAGGPLHETLLETLCRPSALRAGLLAIGLKEGDPADYRNGTPATGDQLLITLNWEGAKAPVKLEEFLWNDRAKKHMETAEWLFTGSDWDSSFLTGEDIYIPDEARVVVALTDNFGHLSVISCNHADSHNEMIWSINQNVLPENLDAEISITITKK
ncbi:MAG: hypothetical protein ACI97A_002192 [Planctomycetota bacterium]|jgi:uncharacterized protein YoxC